MKRKQQRIVLLQPYCCFSASHCPPVSLKLEAIRDLKPPSWLVLPPGEHNRVSVYESSKLWNSKKKQFFAGHVQPIQKCHWNPFATVWVTHLVYKRTQPPRRKLQSKIVAFHLCGQVRRWLIGLPVWPTSWPPGWHLTPIFDTTPGLLVLWSSGRYPAATHDNAYRSTQQR